MIAYVILVIPLMHTKLFILVLLLFQISLLLWYFIHFQIDPLQLQ